MAKKEKRSIMELTKYEVISVEENVRQLDGSMGKRVLLRVPAVGSTVESFIPYHTEEEERQIGANFAHHAFKIAHPDDDPSNYSAVRIVC
ncbi:MAG: hypothetical protein IJJ69_14240 [Oscillospiraceae bacterium]|nr:hypothetical protein [Oscillospiraceae bacterium]